MNLYRKQKLTDVEKKTYDYQREKDKGSIRSMAFTDTNYYT